MNGVKRQGFTPVGNAPGLDQPGKLDVSGFQPRKPHAAQASGPIGTDEFSRAGEGASVSGRPGQGSAAAQEATIAAVRAGFTSRTGGKIDGRRLRRTGRTAQLNAKVDPDLKDRIVTEAASREIAVGELIAEMFDLYAIQKQRDGGASSEGPGEGL